MFSSVSVRDACSGLDQEIKSRLANQPIQPSVNKVRFPVCLFFIRGDRAGDARGLTDQIVASYTYWNKVSEDILDVVFAGWSEDVGRVQFQSEDFITFYQDIETLSNWRYKGETELLLLNYDYSLEPWQNNRPYDQHGEFTFDQVVDLPIETMLRDGQIGSIDGFMQQLMQHAQDAPPRSDEGVVWDIRHKLAVRRGLRAVLFGFIQQHVMQDASKTLDLLQYFTVQDLSRK